ncbi:MAG: PilZ domain-containing protein [Candidatus Hydrogenedentes bacterium]|nr:PilZ domain-containing protein [Candidatus Hydrogenedentota bacterium]
MIQERRKVVRRQADRDLLASLDGTGGSARGGADSDAAARELRHKRRRAIRHNCQVHVALRVAHVSGPQGEWNVDMFPVKGRILDLSSSGASLFTDRPLEIGQELSLVIAMQGTDAIRATGQVRWTKGVPEKHGYASGIHFRSLSEKGKDLIERFLRKLDDTIGL